MRDKRFFSLWEKRGYHVTPVHFYETVPDTRQFREDVFSWNSEMPGVDMNLEGQMGLLERFVAAYKDEYDQFPSKPTERPEQYYLRNQWFDTVDAEILHCMVREFKPRRVVEIGCGFSTRVTTAAIRRNREENPDYQCELICIDPNPRPEIRNGFEGISRLIEKPVQETPLELFTALEDGDILFIDSSHVISLGNDVWFEYLEVLPRLNKGAIVHVHDILLPRLYVEHWSSMKMFWNEQFLLQAFLAFNKHFAVMWAGNYMHAHHREELKRAFASYAALASDDDLRRPISGHKSFWMRRVC